MKKTSLLLILTTITVFGQNQSRLVQNKTIIDNVENNSIESVPRQISYQGLIFLGSKDLKFYLVGHS